MKKTILLLFGFLSTSIFAQSQYTVEQTEKSNDPKVVANFIVNYPTHPKNSWIQKEVSPFKCQQFFLAHIDFSPAPKQPQKPPRNRRRSH